MGAHDYIVTIEGDKKKVTKRWEQIVEDDGYESGEGAYAGNATTMRGSITFYDRRLGSENEAREFCLNKHEKWNGPVAVSFYLPVAKTERDEKRVKKAVEHYDKLWEKAKAIIVKANDALRARKSKMIGCSECGSKLSKTHYLEAKGRALSLLYSRQGVWLSTFGCLVCQAPLVSSTVMKRAMAYEPKLKAAQEAITEAGKPKAGKKIAWAVGGWAAS